MIYLPATGALTLPDGMLKAYAGLLVEQRSGTVGFVPTASMGDGKAPTDADLQGFYKSHVAAYTIANWDRLTRFDDNALVPLDNNATERAIRGPVVGRKNHYGSRSRSGTEVAATLYTLIETAKLSGIDPEAYLRAVLIKIADHPIARIDELLPWKLKSCSAVG